MATKEKNLKNVLKTKNTELSDSKGITELGNAVLAIRHHAMSVADSALLAHYSKDDFSTQWHLSQIETEMAKLLDNFKGFNNARG